MRVTASHIATLADHKDAKAELPRLVQCLCFEAETSQHSLPAGKSICATAWDGTFDSERGNNWVPVGASYWELRCNKGITVGANAAYKQRTEQYSEAERLNATFVFLTLRRWSTKSQWLSGHRAKAEWANVLAFDADDLEQWLAQSPASSLQFAVELSLDARGVESPARYWQRWSEQCSPVISVAALLNDRTRSRERLLSKIHDGLGQSTPPTLTVTGDSQEEAVAFVIATLNEYPALLSSSLVVTDEDGWQFVQANPQLRIAIAVSSETAASSTPRDNLLLIVPHAAGNIAGKPEGDELLLQRSQQTEFEKVLVFIGMEDSAARQYALSSGCSWSVLRRQCANNPAFRHPAWLDATQVPSLAVLCLLGIWSEDTEADRLQVSQLADQPYEEIERELQELSRVDDSPVVKIGVMWQAKSPMELFALYGERISREQLNRFFRIAHEILAAPDPQLQLPDGERYAAKIYGKVKPYSDLLQGSVCDALVKLAVGTAEHPGLQAFGVTEWVHLLVRDLLEFANAERWLSLASFLPIFAEAAPETLLWSIEKSGDSPHAPVTRLLTETSEYGSFGGRIWHAGLLLALEKLAWSPAFLSRVTLVLAQLCHAPSKGNLGKTPQNSLFNLFRCWRPQTAADIPTRIKALDLLIARDPDIAFVTLDALVHRGAKMPSQRVRKARRGGDAGSGRAFAGTEMWLMRRAARERLIQCSAGNASHIAMLFENAVLRDEQELAKVLVLAETLALADTNDEDRELIRTSLRKKIHWHRSNENSQVSASDELLDAVESLYQRLAPIDLVTRHRWLFSYHCPQFPFSVREGNSGSQSWQREEARKVALSDIYQARGMQGVECLIQDCADANTVGATLAATECGKDNWAHWVVKIAKEFPRGSAITYCISGLLSYLPALRSTELIKEVLAQADIQSWEPARCASFLVLARPERITWELAAACGSETARAYWLKVDVDLLRGEASELDFVLRRLTEVQRPRSALRCCQNDLQLPDTTLLFEMLQRFLSGEEAQASLPDFRDLGGMLAHLESAEEIERTSLIQLEFKLFPALTPRQQASVALLYEAIMTEPILFSELICIQHKPAHYKYDKPDTEAGRNAAESASDILRSCSRQPGTRADGSISQSVFNQFINEARELCRQADRLDVCDYAIGKILAKSPADEDGIWPFALARHLLERPEMEAVRKGFVSGIKIKPGEAYGIPLENRRYHSDLADYYRNQAQKLHFFQPSVACLLEEIAKKIMSTGIAKGQ